MKTNYYIKFIYRSAFTLLVLFHLFLYPVFIDEDVIVNKIENTNHNLHFHHFDHLFADKIEKCELSIVQNKSNCKTIKSHKNQTIESFNTIWKPPKHKS